MKRPVYWGSVSERLKSFLWFFFSFMRSPNLGATHTENDSGIFHQDNIFDVTYNQNNS